MARIRLTIDLDIDLNDEYIDDAMARIDAIPAFIAGEGLFTGNSSAEVNSWSHTIEQLPY